MRLGLALGLGTGVFALMTFAAHAQFSPSAAPGIENVQAQVMSEPSSQFLPSSGATPIQEGWAYSDQGQASAAAAVNATGADSGETSWTNMVQAEVQRATQAHSAAQIQFSASLSSATGDGVCQAAIAQAEKKYNLPPYILQAIALTESGRGGDPYPWAMNIKGRAYYASGPAEVEQIVRQHGERSSIDIGCSQVNLKYHGHRFSDWRVLLDPVTNADYAAFHLVELYREMGGWSKAVAAYHSRTNWRGANYACKVSQNYGNLLGDRRKGCGPDIERLATYLYANVSR